MACPRYLLPLLAAFMILVGGCATGTVYLQLNQLPTDETLRSDLGAQKFNAVRFVTVGSTTSQNIGYFLYGDNVEVSMLPGVPLERISGKMSLRETVADYFGMSKSVGNRRISPPIVREAIRGKEVAGYSVADMNMGIGVWDRPGAGDASKINSRAGVRTGGECKEIEIGHGPLPLSLCRVGPSLQGKESAYESHEVWSRVREVGGRGGHCRDAGCRCLRVGKRPEVEPDRRQRLMKSEAGKQKSSTRSGSRRSVRMRSSFSDTSCTRTGSRSKPAGAFRMTRLGQEHPGEVMADYVSVSKRG